MIPAVAESTASRRPWAVAAAVWFVSLALVVAWLTRTPAEHLREQLKVWQFWSLDACVLVGLFFGLLAFKTVRDDLDRRDGWRLMALAIIALALTLLVAPRMNRIFFDEQIYQSIGLNLADQRLAQVCNDGSIEDGRLRCAIGEYSKQPYAYPHVLSLAYRLFGVHAATAFVVNAVAMALTACFVYLLVYVLFRDRDAALLAGLLIALIPEQIMWSATASVEPSASLACIVALVCAAYYARSGGGVLLGAGVASTAYAIQFRPESILIVPIAMLIAWPRLRCDLERPLGWWAVILFLWLAAVHIGHLYAVRHADWGAPGPRFSLGHVPANLRVNGWFYLHDERFPLVYTLLAILGLFIGRYPRERLAMAMYFLLFFALDLAFYAGSYNYGADVRYSLMTYPAIAVLGGSGAAELVRQIRRRARGIPVLTLTVTFLAFQFLWYAPIVRTTAQEGWAARADVRFARSFAQKLPPDSYVLTHNPGMFHLWGVNAGQMSLALANRDYVSLMERRYTGGLYLHWNFWCNAHDNGQQEICRKAIALGRTEMITEYRERDERYAFYRMTLAK